MRSVKVFFKDVFAGIYSETNQGYQFSYDTEYLQRSDAEAISLTLPLRKEPYKSFNMLPFFDGLIPEGWLLDIAIESWKLSQRDRMALLEACCFDCIGAVSIQPMEEIT